MKVMKKILSTTICASMILSLFGQSTQAMEPTEPVLGVSVSENTLFTESTPDAHYQATFTLDTSNFEKKVTKVEVGGNMQFYTEDQLSEYLKNEGTDNPEFVLPGYTAYEYKNNMFTTGIAIDVAKTGKLYYLYELKQIEGKENLWTGTIPLPGGQYFYDYFITYEDGTTETIKDPANMPVANGTSDSGHSLFYVGNRNDCITGEEYVFPRTDSQVGTVDFVNYTASDDSIQSLGIYLPYGYDVNKTYKTLYLSHGGGGNEVEWFYIGSAKNIFDNLIAEGLLEPTIIVTMDNQKSPFNFEKGESVKNIIENIIPYVEENYSVSTERKDRAMAGLSSGASVTVQAMLQANDTFDYYGVFSPSRTLNFVDESLTDEMREDMKDAEMYYVSCGIYDSYLRRDVNVQVYEELVASGANAVFEWKNGSHDWGVWRNQLTTFAKDYLWNERPVVIEDIIVDVPTIDPNKAVNEVTVGVKASEKTNQMLVDSIDNDEVLSNAVTEALNLGKEVTIIVTIVKIDAATATAEQKADIAKIEKEVEAKGLTIAQYLDLSILVKADSDELGKIRNTNNPIVFEISIPENLKKTGRVFKVIRIHDGVVKELETKENNGIITFESDRFSTYALTYKDNTTSTSTTGDSTNMNFYVAMCGLAMLAGASIVLKKKKEVL